MNYSSTPKTNIFESSQSLFARAACPMLEGIKQEPRLESFEVLPNRPLGAQSSEAKDACWYRLHDNAMNPNKIVCEISAGDRNGFVNIVSQGIVGATGVGAVYAHNRKNGETFCWSSKSNSPLPVKIGFHRRLKKNDISFFDAPSRRIRCYV